MLINHDDARNGILLIEIKSGVVLLLFVRNIVLRGRCKLCNGS
jgi:hypothetical protein